VGLGASQTLHFFAAAEFINVHCGQAHLTVAGGPGSSAPGAPCAPPGLLPPRPLSFSMASRGDCFGMRPKLPNLLASLRAEPPPPSRLASPMAGLVGERVCSGLCA